MLNQPTIDKLYELRLFGMARALEEQNGSSKYETLGFSDRLGLLVDRERAERDSTRLRLRLKQAKLRLTAAIEDVDFRHPRGLDKSLVLSLAGWPMDSRTTERHHHRPYRRGQELPRVRLGPQKPAGKVTRALYLRAPRLFDDLAMAKADGRYRKILAAYTRLDPARHR